MADVRTPELVINKLSKQQYENIQNPSDTELYLVPEDEEHKPICYPTTASEVGTTSMVVKSSVSDNGKILTENGFVYNTSGNPTVSDTKVICDLGVGFMEKVLENLTRNTEYHIKSYGQNANGLVYGSELVQRTKSVTLPSDYPEFLQLWLRADSVELTDGKVSRWYDLSPNQYEIVQTNESARPTINENALNGLPALQFNGTSTYLIGGDVLDIGTKNWTWFIIGNYFTDEEGALTPCFLGKYDRNTNWNSQPHWTIGKYFRLIHWSPTYSYTEISSNVSTYTTTIFCYELFNREDNSNSVYANNRLINKEIFANDFGNINNNIPLKIGGNIKLSPAYPNGNYLNGNIAEIIAFNTINETMRNNISLYLSERYNIPLDS